VPRLWTRARSGKASSSKLRLGRWPHIRSRDGSGLWRALVLSRVSARGSRMVPPRVDAGGGVEQHGPEPAGGASRRDRPSVWIQYR